MPVVMTIAGSDSGGGAGIQADLKTFAAHGVFGTSAITAITAQNTLDVVSIAEVPVEVISDQIDVVAQDIGIDVVKTGMLSSTEIIECVAVAISRNELGPIVVDPVMVAASGAHLLQEEAVDAMRDRIVPMATVLTPNIPEAEVLADIDIETVDDMVSAGESLLEMGADAVVVKGGHLESRDDALVDVLVNSDGVSHFRSMRVESSNLHGTGCTFASAIASRLALGDPVPVAVQSAQRFVMRAILSAPGLGSGHGPLNHSFGVTTD